MAHGVDLSVLSDTELDGLLDDVKAEVSRRVVVANAPARIREINQQVLNASGIAPGDPWDKKMRTRGGYSKGWTVTHRDGIVFESQIDNNVWEPGDPADPQTGRWWAPRLPEPEPGEVLPWAPGQNVTAGDRRSHDGKVWRAKIAHATHVGWAPSVHTHAVWEEVAA